MKEQQKNKNISIAELDNMCKSSKPIHIYDGFFAFHVPEGYMIEVKVKKVGRDPKAVENPETD